MHEKYDVTTISTIVELFGGKITIAKIPEKYICRSLWKLKNSESITRAFIHSSSKIVSSISLSATLAK